MNKFKKWHVYLIALVMLLTLYNILPTVIYYSKPLNEPIDQKRAEQIALETMNRVNNLEIEAIEWIESFSKNLGLNPKSIQSLKQNPQPIEVAFSNPDQAKRFKAYLPRAGALISFVPAQLSLTSSIDQDPDVVIVERKINTKLNAQSVKELMHYVPKNSDGAISEAYKDLVLSRFNQIALTLGGNTLNAQLVQSLNEVQTSPSLDQELVDLASSIVNFEKNFKNSSIASRYYKSFSQINPHNSNASATLVDHFEKLSKRLSQEISDTKDQEILESLKNKKELVTSAVHIVKQHQSLIDSGEAALTTYDLKQVSLQDQISTLILGDKNPFIDKLTIDWQTDTFSIILHQDVEKIRGSSSQEIETLFTKEKLEQLLINEIAKISQETSETIVPTNFGFTIALNQLTNSQSLLVMDLGYLAKQEVETLKENLQNRWSPQSPEFANNSFPIWDYETYQKLSAAEKKFGLLLYAPVIDSTETVKGFRNSSIYIVAKGLQPILQKYQQYANLEQAERFKEDFLALQNLIRQQGYTVNFIALGPQYPKSFQQDIIFEHTNYYQDFLAATRENFVVYGNKRFAALEFTDVEQRILTSNKIEGQMHEELLRWKEDYQAAQVDLVDTQNRFFIPPPTHNIYLDNLKLSFKEYFRGDSRKIIKWGLDLSGGKSILIELRDHNNRPITDKVDLMEGVNELTQRVNKMGLSEVDIRVEGSHIALDFPSSKGLSASELIKGSTMSFHVVNEKFASKNSPYYMQTQKFLQDVWNEAVITNRKDAQSINEIAWRHLGGSFDGSNMTPRTEYAKELLNHGFKLAPPQNFESQPQVDQTFSKVAIYRGTDYTEWHGQTHPLTMVFANFALEGSDLENIKANYDATQGNVLTFDVKSTAKSIDKQSPRTTIFNWSSQFAKDRVMGTANEKYTPSRGWRMAIILNGLIINDPQLNQPLKDHIQVTGGFTQHEAHKLAADLKAGSLSFTPQILSEENVSADLGQKERMQGIVATIVSLLLVVSVMIGYYRFAGVIASLAVICNLLIMWGVLQNLQATLTLSGIAGIVLTVGMAVDANVLVFERIREELKHTKKLATAIMMGYQKAFNAIFDSNITTIIAALILLSFDSGPIKGLAITLTIGIASSMFTALFMTRTFFYKWVEGAKDKSLSMANWFKFQNLNFLKHAKWISALCMAVILIGGTLMFHQRSSIIGMDFTGGYSLNIQFDENSSRDYRQEVSKALLQAGLKNSDFQVRELSLPNMLRIQLSSQLDERNYPFYGMPVELTLPSTLYAWQKNPRLNWVVDTLAANHLPIASKNLNTLDKNWSEMSGQLSKTTRNNALIGLLLALVSILIYISFRFEFKYALSAVLCTLHDVVITLAILSILHLIGIPLQINLQVIAALMTIIGYSLNDTIIVFDRIREERQLQRRSSFDQVINYSLSVTLNRTMMTSFTTFIVLMALVCLGGNKIFDFSFVMGLGVVLGTLSSLFIAPILLRYFHGKEETKTISLPTIEEKPVA